MSTEQRFSFFASSPLCAISWTFEGTGHLMESDEQIRSPSSAPAFPEIAFSGPYNQPQVSWCDGNFYAMTLAFYPDAFAAISGVSLSKYANRSVPVQDVLSDDLLGLVVGIPKLGDAHRAFEKLEEALAPIWRAARPDDPAFGYLVSDWCKMLATRAAFSGAGKSTRQIERRFRSWTGQSQRKLLAYAKGEEAFKYALDKQAKGKLDLADMSVDLGFSDQSHMGRRVKEITGFSPAEFMKRYENDEAFWCFRLMGDRI